MSRSKINTAATQSTTRSTCAMDPGLRGRRICSQPCPSSGNGCTCQQGFWWPWLCRDQLGPHPEIHTKLGVKIDAHRLQNTTPEALEAWFEKFKKVKTEHQVED